jgi:phage baseplate assembly protein W
MQSWNFPNIFKGNGVDIIKDREAALSNLNLLINSEIFEYRFDPEYGSKIPMLLYRPKNQLTKDLIADACYELQAFCPNIRFRRDQVVIKYTEPGEAEIYIPITIDNNNFTTDIILYAEAKN